MSDGIYYGCFIRISYRQTTSWKMHVVSEKEWGEKAKGERGTWRRDSCVGVSTWTFVGVGLTRQDEPCSMDASLGAAGL